jgi:hypothetical protein
MMGIAIALNFILAAGSEAGGSDVSRYQVERGSQLEKELGYKISVQDKNGRRTAEMGWGSKAPLQNMS